MTTEQQRKMLECAAKACGIEGVYAENGYRKTSGIRLADDSLWNPLTNALDTAEMCAELDIGTEFHSALGYVVCRKSIDMASLVFYKDRDNSRLKAWMHAATMVAAKTQGHEE